MERGGLGARQPQNGRLLGNWRAACRSKGWSRVDESYFGGVRKGKRGRGAAGKIPEP